MAVIDVYLISDHEFDYTLFADSLLTPNDIGIMNVRNMANKLVKMCANGDKIANLRIVGHGNEYGQSIGSDWITQDNLKDHFEQLNRLSPLFVRSTSTTQRARVVMGGCRQGRNGGLLLALSGIWNVPVIGFTALQRPPFPGDEGGETTCYITCTREGRTAADKVDEIQLAIMEWVRRHI